VARDAGFSLLELMVALSVFAIIILIGIPGFQSMIQSSREKASRESRRLSR
jgi:prepilin-type N-terminal cleavage/methylation domain-containing protein